ncbi:ATP-binding protein [Ferruginibacter yonginensis]|uniref:histidine kinase n=1 Tax=Ferruginibacter yonginensis TaxID=1310416 RepID=A0ABV8QVP7_9BACT
MLKQSIKIIIYFKYQLLCCVLLLNFQIVVKAQNNFSNDTNNIKTTLNKGIQLAEQLPEKALPYLQSAYNQSKTAQYKNGIALASLSLGRWYFGNNIGKSIAYAYEALQNFDNSNNNVEAIADTHLLLAEAYDEQGIKDSSAYYYYLLDAEMDAGTFPNAEFAVRMFTKLTIFWVNLDYGNVINEEYKKTVNRFLDKAKMYANKLKDTADAKSSFLFLQGAYHHGLKQYDSARLFYNEYLIRRTALKKLSITRKVSTLFNIADTYLQETKPNEALKFINQIKAIGSNPQNTQYLAFYISLIDLLTAKAYYQKKEYPATIALLDKALIDLKSTGLHFRNEVVESYDIYASSYQAMGNFSKALEYKNIYSKLYDSITKKDKVDIISRLEIKNRMAEKDKELVLQKLALSEINSKVRYKNSLIIGISVFALSGFIIFALWRKKNISKQKLQDERIENLQQKIKIERLKASITGEEKERTRIGRELHDGIGGLLSVARMNFELAKKQSVVDENADFNDGVKLLEEATVELRKAAYNLMPEVLLTQGLASAVQAFCEKMMSKSATNITFQSIGDRSNISSAFDLPIYRIIQELVHNIIKHAQAKNALVQLNFENDGTINITVEDDGIGLPPDAFEKTLSMGLKNTKERVSDLGGKIDIQSSNETGTSIYLEFEALQEKIDR